MARLFAESDDGTHRVLLFVDDEHWNATCTRHPDFVVEDRSRHSMQGVYEEAKSHVDS